MTVDSCCKKPVSQNNMLYKGQRGIDFIRFWPYELINLKNLQLLNNDIGSPDQLNVTPITHSLYFS